MMKTKILALIVTALVSLSAKVSAQITGPWSVGAPSGTLYSGAPSTFKATANYNFTNTSTTQVTVNFSGSFNISGAGSYNGVPNTPSVVINPGQSASGSVDFTFTTTITGAGTATVGASATGGGQVSTSSLTTSYTQPGGGGGGDDNFH